MNINKINSFLVLVLFWIFISGMFGAMLLSLGVLSCLLVVYICCNKMNIIAQRNHTPISFTPKGFIYSLWLVKEIVVSSFSVALKVFARNPQISSKIGIIKSKQVNNFGKMIYGNSITLTPGTITVDIVDDEFEIHALEGSSIDDLDHNSGGGDMDNKVKRVV